MKEKKDWNNLLRIVTFLVGAVISLVSIWISFYIKFLGQVPDRNFSAFESSYLWIMVGFVIVNALFETYVFYRKTYLDLFFFTMLSQLFMSFYMMALTYAGSWLTFPRSVILVNFFVGTFILYLYNALAYWLYHRLSGSKKVLIIGPEANVLEAVNNFATMNNRRHIVTHVILSDYYQQLKTYLDQVDIVYVTGDLDEKERNKIYDLLMRTRKQLFIATNFSDLMMVNPNMMSFEDESVIEIAPFAIPFEQLMLKRMFDFVVSLVMLIILSPVMIITAIAIKSDSPGPIFYLQERVTLNQRVFKMIKFRSMTASAEKDSGPVLAKSNDQRITQVGKFIRATRIDEIPQLINVLLGDMSLVGPRPERPFFVHQYIAANPYYELRHHVRAGITGYAQVYGKYTTNFNNKLNFDLVYIKNYSLAFDMKLLFQTLKILFDKVSAKGLDEENLTPLTLEDYRDQITIVD